MLARPKAMKILLAMLDIEALGHEARLMVVDWTRYCEIYTFAPFEQAPQ